MTEFYAQIRNIHLLAVSLSGFLFFCRAFYSISGKNWPHLLFVRSIVYIIDIILLTSAISLIIILPKSTFENGWLYFKICLVLFYIMSGFGAMRIKFSKLKRVGFLVLSLCLYILIIGIARAHNIMGWFIN